MAELDKDIMEAIQKNLPQVTAGVLRKELEELERLRDLDKKYTTLSEIHGKQSDKLHDQQSELATWKKREADLLQREGKLKEDEIRLELSLVKEQLRMTQESRLEIQKLAETVFRNKTIVETVNRLGEYPHFGPNGQAPVAVQVGGIETTTKTEG